MLDQEHQNKLPLFSESKTAQQPAKMVRRYSPLCTIFFYFFVFPTGSGQSKLSSTQTALMLHLSEIIQNTSSSSPWTRKPADPCSWKGVECSSSNPGVSSSITGLSLNNFALSGSDIFPVICQIGTLQTIDLSNNHLNSIPADFITGCGGISDLKLLNLSLNMVSGNLPVFNGFNGLEILDVAYNWMNGRIDSQLDGLVRLKSLNLSFNNFTGPVPIHLGKSMLLEHLRLSMNGFHGEIPEQLFDYPNLTLIALNGNNLFGSIPSRIGELSKLEILVLSLNSLNGQIPKTLSNIKTLSRFAANQNNFGGTIPAGLTSYLKNLDLSYNQLGGSIPQDLLSQPYIQAVDLSYNMLNNQIPAGLSPSLVRLRLGSNSLNGTIPSVRFGGARHNLTYLELNNNSLSGTIPSELASYQNLTLLDLGNNKLGGALPAQLSNLSELHVLRLQSNKLDGTIPPELCSLTNLLVLNLSGNSFSGPIPPSISSLQKLTNLNLEGNNFSGSIPSSVSKLPALLELQLGRNRLSGDIPEMPAKLQIALNVSGNRFEGRIPITLSKLTVLEVLDLSSNKFFGEIPGELTQMAALTKLVLSNNLLLSGVIPNFRNTVTIDSRGTDLSRPNPSPSPGLAPLKKRKSVAVAATVAASVAALVVVAMTSIIWMISRRFYRVSAAEHIQPEGEAFSRPQQVIQGKILTANSIHRSHIDFAKAMEVVSTPSNIVQKMKFSTYYKAILPSGMRYFIKKLNSIDKIFQLENHSKLEGELQVLGKLNNSNVMTPLAYVFTVDSAYIFYEFAHKGTLFDVLHYSSENVLDWASRYSIALGVAQGLAFLHGRSTGPILLLDLSSKTIMMKSIMEPLIGDVELYKVIDHSKSTSSLSLVAGSVGYIPPEYAYTMRVTTAGNVYSFGVILLELLTGKPALSKGTELAKWVLSQSAQQDTCDHILDLCISRTSLAIKRQMLAVLKVALDCVSLSSEERPNMKSVVHMLINARLM